MCILNACLLHMYANIRLICKLTLKLMSMDLLIIKICM